MRMYAKAIFGTLAILFALNSSLAIMNGNLKSGLTPGWIDFAMAHPTVFAFILVIGGLLIGEPFIEAVSNS